MPSVHDTARTGFGSGTNELYDRARPTYPAPSLSFIRSKLSSSGPFSIVEIGSGTGLFTRSLLAHPEWKDVIASIHAIEPSEGMRNTFLEKTQDERVSIQDGTFTETAEPDGWADAVIVAQAFHWAHPYYDSAMKEIARILKPSGVAFFMWNMEDRDRANWVAAIRDQYEAYEKDTPQFRLNLWEETFRTPNYIRHFHPPERFFTEWVLATTEAGVQDRVLSKSYIAIVSQEEKAALMSRIAEILDQEDKKWIDQSRGTFEYPYKTTVISMKKLS